MAFRYYIADGFYVLASGGLKNRFIDLQKNFDTRNDTENQNPEEIKMRFIKAFGRKEGANDGFDESGSQNIG